MKTFLRIIPFLLLLLAPAFASASTVEIRTLEEFKQEAELLRTTPISQSEKLAQLEQLERLTLEAKRSSALLLSQDRQVADNILNNSLDRADEVFEQETEATERLYIDQVTAILKWADLTKEKAKTQYKRTVTKINQAAQAELSRCKTNACRQAVEKRRRTQIAVATEQLNKELAVIELSAEQQIESAQKQRKEALQQASLKHEQAVQRVKQEHSSAVKRSRITYYQRNDYIANLQSTAKVLIEERPVQ